MNLADVFTFLFVILGLVAVFTAYWLAAAGLCPVFVERSAERLGRIPGRMFWLGAVTLVPLVIFGGRMASRAPNGALKLLALALVLLPLLAALVGSAGWALRLGEGLKSSVDATEPWRRVLRGGITLGLCFVLPIVGQLAALPFILLSGFGAFLAGWWKRGAAPALSSAAAHSALPPQITTPAPAPAV